MVTENQMLRLVYWSACKIPTKGYNTLIDADSFAGLVDFKAGLCFLEKLKFSVLPAVHSDKECRFIQ